MIRHPKVTPAGPADLALRYLIRSTRCPVGRSEVQQRIQPMDRGLEGQLLHIHSSPRFGRDDCTYSEAARDSRVVDT